jgi:hypothetical protein
VVVHLSRPLAQRLVDNYGVIDSSIQTADDVSKIQATQIEGLSVTYQVDDVIDPRYIKVEPDGEDAYLVPLPTTL